MPIENGVMMQFFHWYTPADGTLWDEASSRAGELSRAGFTEPLQAEAAGQGVLLFGLDDVLGVEAK